MADEIRASAVDDKIGGIRGPAYPYVNLERAIEKATIIAEKGAARQKMPPETFYKLWGMGAKSSASRQTMAALNYYDLVEYVGRGSDRKVQLTELALRIVLDKQPNSAARRDAIQKAALEPPIFRELHDRYAPFLPDDVVIETFLKLERAFSDDAALVTIKHFRDTMSYAGLDKPTYEPDNGDSSGHETGSTYGKACVGDLIDWEVNGVIGNPSPMRVTAVSDDKAWVFVSESQSGLPMEQVIVRDELAPPPPAVMQPPVNPFALKKPQDENIIPPQGHRSEKFDADEGVITISWPANLSTQSVEDMQEWVGLLMKRIERRARAGEDADKAKAMNQADD
jgi:hypothetical protein